MHDLRPAIAWKIAQFYFMRFRISKSHIATAAPNYWRTKIDVIERQDT